MNFDLWLASMVCAKKRARHSNGHTSTLIYLDSKLSSQKCQILTSRSTMGKKVGQFWFRSLSGCMLRGAGVGKPSFFLSFFIKVLIDNILVHIIRALNNTTSYDYSKRYVMRSRYGLPCGNRQVTRGLAIYSHENSSFCHSSRLHNESQSQDHPHHRSHNLCVLCKGQCTFHSCCSACHSRSHRSKSTQRVVGEVVEQEKEMRIRPG